MNRRSFLQLIGLFGAEAALGPVLNGCARKFIRKEKEVPKFESLEIKLVPFPEYFPASSRARINLRDKLLETYVSQEHSIYSLLFNDSPLIKQAEKEREKRISIEDYDKFKSEIIAGSKELGVNKEKIKSLTIHEALMLSGRLVASHLEYDPALTGKAAEENIKRYRENPGLLLEEILKGKEIRTEKEKIIDNSTADKVWREGKAICRNYAPVNVAVFKVLKEMNPNLRNTYIKVYYPQSGDDILIFPHAWNVVFTVERGREGLGLAVTYVDPTWLDTRPPGEKIEEAYNGLDADHFHTDKHLLAEIYLAELYEGLGNCKRNEENNVPKDFYINQEATGFYLGKAAEQRIKICNLALDIIEKSPEKLKPEQFILGNSFTKAVENMTFNPVIAFVENKITEQPRDRYNFIELKRLYERASRIVPGFIREKNLFYGVKYFDSEEKKISMKKLFAMVNDTYLK